MMGFFRRARAATADTSMLGSLSVAVRVPGGVAVPAQACGVVFDQAGRIRRVDAGARIALLEGESAACFHPGPYRIDIVPFAAAPEIGLRAAFAVDAADPRVAQQRFDLYLVSEAAGELTLAGVKAAIEAAVQRELAQGHLELAPCTSLDEWNTFRAGFNQLLYTRFGITVDDCVPVDLGDAVDYAQMLRERAAGAAAPARADEPVACGTEMDHASTDRQALRRLFLELPSVMCALRLGGLPCGQGLFGKQQALLQRFDLASLEAGTMPALALAAPCQPLALDEQARRARASLRAAATLDESWALLARLAYAQPEALDGLFDELDRIAANLELALADRRRAHGEPA